MKIVPKPRNLLFSGSPLVALLSSEQPSPKMIFVSQVRNTFSAFRNIYNSKSDHSLSLFPTFGEANCMIAVADLLVPALVLVSSLP